MNPHRPADPSADRPVMAIDPAGWLAGAARRPSPHCDDRPDGAPIDLLVIHNISLPPGEFGGEGIVRLFTNDLDCSAHPFYRTLEGRRVSAHFLIRRTGELLLIFRRLNEDDLCSCLSVKTAAA